ncbi:hypothetical protein D0469_20560 [Peribacillus saganii]|uniref:Uncharacterized protein n=1 Tax=Peribacillus saganii TaxID=2303992 RepID=A0A372L9L3_9BACI|nr:PD40 domain-containing protein [Peribacillus saganii]RFU62298.1 hypothetical protein D0469_20560 [Peribacillus saganii]
MRKRYLYLFGGLVLTLTAILAVMGFKFEKTEQEKQEGLADQYDVSAQDTVAYVSYKRGKPGLYIFNNKLDIEEKVIEFENSKSIIDPSFSSDGTKVAFITANKNPEKDLSSTVHLLDLRTKEVTELFKSENMVTELDFSPVSDSLFFLGAGTFGNYSPIASKRTHDLDVFEYKLAEKETVQRTSLKKYSMTSLNVSPDGTSIFVQMDDDLDADTPEETFETKQRVFQIALDSPEDLHVVTDPNKEIDITELILAPSGNEIIYQSISNPDDDGTYKYELFSYHLESKKEHLVTHFGNFVGRPRFSSDVSLYFIADKNWPNRVDNHLYRMDLKTKEIKEVILPEK